MDTLTQSFYARHAGQLACEYDKAKGMIEPRLERAFAGHRRILDVGCGTGRDLAYLLKLGKDALGADPVAEMLATAAETLLRNGLDPQERLFEAGLPDMACFAAGDFDGLLCSAVFMHLPDEQVFDAVYTLRRLLKSGGTLLLSIPENRPGIDPITRRDAAGRLFADWPAAKLQLLFERVGFVIKSSTVVADSLGRPGHDWRVLEMIKAEGETRPLHLVESVLSRDKKDATYKLALFRALAEIAQKQHHLAIFSHAGKVLIPIEAIADKWLLYYWPLFASPTFISQRTGEERGKGNGVTIRPPLERLIGHFANTGGMAGFHAALSAGRLDSVGLKLWRVERSKLQQTIWTMPVRHAGGGEYSVFQYDRAQKAVAMDAELWRELCFTGSWIHDATVLRWAELSQQLSKDAVAASTVIDCLLTVADEGRSVHEIRGFFLRETRLHCVWSGRELSPQRLAVDHAMPFSLWRNNDFWNLLPADSAINARKRDKLPTYSQLQYSRDHIIDCWQRIERAFAQPFRNNAQTLLGHETLPPANWEAKLFARFVEAFEVTAAQRGVPRWEDAACAKRHPIPATTLEATASAAPPHAEVQAAADSSEPVLLEFPEIQHSAFHRYLPVVADLAAGFPFHGFATGSMDDLADLPWIAVAPHLARQDRFVVRVAGNSMSPTLEDGDVVVFEYHRSPRSDGQIVIANIPEFPESTHGTEAIKRLRQDSTHWIFTSDNPQYPSFSVPKCDTGYPILGTYVAHVK